MPSFKVAVLSDLHAAPKAVAAPAGEVKLFTDQDHAGPTEHPLIGLRALIKKEALTANVVVCPGDMTNKANPQALGYVWKSLHELRALLRAEQVVATVGNHDVDSRGHSPDNFPRESLMRLDPPFPASKALFSDRYWAHGYYIEEVGDARFLVLNTCWLHEARDELERGVVTDYTLERIAKDLESTPAKALSIAVCHHHPHPHTELKLGFDDVIRNGQKFLDLLSEHGHWMVIHGHKHHPKVEYAQGQYQQPLVVACGSFSGRLEGDNALVSKNYFHVIDIELASGRISGQLVSWAWIPGLGWRRYNSSPPSFPTLVGFWSSTDVTQLAGAIKGHVGTMPAVDWSALTAQIPELKFLMPRQLNGLFQLLKSSHRIRVVFDDLGLPSQVGPEVGNV